MQLKVQINKYKFLVGNDIKYFCLYKKEVTRMNIRLEDLPEDTHQLVEIVGMEKMIEIVKSYGGDTLYIPMYSSLVRCDKTKKVVKEYNGKNGRALMRKYGITYSQLQYMLKKK